MARRTITRRKFMQLSAAVTAGSLLAACGAGDADEPAADQPAAEAPAESEAPAAESSSQYNEAPMLKAMVDAGDLPPVDDRLPVNPRIVTPIHEVGQYSESIRGFTLNETDRAAPAYIAVLSTSPPTWRDLAPGCRRAAGNHTWQRASSGTVTPPSSRSICARA